MVYRAMDTRLNRLVALKVCQSEFVSRFEREARAIAALNHPNICQIYDVGPSCIVMEWVDGAPLAPIVVAGQEKMALDDVLRLANEIVSAIAVAHAKGIIHRDLKPGNILISKQGSAKLLDFGIARQLQRDGEANLATLTGERLLIGTPAYMAPEQAECKSVDERSDIFSFGAVFYEMLSGKRAFPGTSTVSILAAILHRSPDPLDAPPVLAGIVARCLAKAPEDRYQSANELLEALQEAEANERGVIAHSTVRATSRIRKSWPLVPSIGLLLAIAVGVGLWTRESAHRDSNSIAVLPFDMQSKDPDAEYISDGIAGSINNSLTKLSVLQVIPNSVTQNYRGRAADFQQIGKVLNVATVLSGKVVQHGDDLLISIELDDVHTGKQVWGQQYARKMSELLQVQNDISREVSQKLQAQLSVADRQKMTLGSTTNPDASLRPETPH